MKRILAILLLLTSSTYAFEPKVWLARRAEFQADALLMRASYTNIAAKVSEPAEDIKVPVEVYPTGSVKTLIEARRAQIFLKENLVWGESVVISQFDEKGLETLRVEAKHLIFDRVRKRGWAEGPAKVIHGKSCFKGVNVYLATDEEYVLSFESSDLESKNLQNGGLPL